MNLTMQWQWQWQWQYQDQDAAYFFSTAVVNGVVYVGSYERGAFYALNANTGALLWKYMTGGPIPSSPAVVNNIV